MITETELAEKIHDAILRKISAKSQQKLMKIIISCDAMDSFDIKRINEHWQRIAKEPQLVGSHIEIQHRPQIARCVMCNREFEIDEQTLTCPFCRCEQFRLTHKPPVIESYQMYE